jgi:uncharacterized protein YkwD
VAGLTRSLVCATLACVALGLGIVAPAATAAADEPCADATLTPRRDNLERTRAATLCLLNAERAQRDLGPLHANDQLERAAQAFSGRMVRERFFAHVSPGGSTLESRVRRGTRYLTGSVRGWSLGENLAWGSLSLSTPRATVRAWMHSTGHRRNILNGRFRDIGIGVAPGAPAPAEGTAATYTTDFGYRAAG